MSAAANVRRIRATGVGRAKGNTRAAMPYLRRIVISLDDETFDVIADRAFKEHRPFAAVARELIEFGLMAEEGEL